MESDEQAPAFNALAPAPSAPEVDDAPTSATASADAIAALEEELGAIETELHSLDGSTEPAHDATPSAAH